MLGTLQILEQDNSKDKQFFLVFTLRKKYNYSGSYTTEFSCKTNSDFYMLVTT